MVRGPLGPVPSANGDGGPKNHPEALGNLTELVQKDREERAAKCGQEVNDLLKKYRCRMIFQEAYQDGVSVNRSFVILPVD